MDFVFYAAHLNVVLRGDTMSVNPEELKEIHFYSNDNSNVFDQRSGLGLSDGSRR